MPTPSIKSKTKPMMSAEAHDFLVNFHLLLLFRFNFLQILCAHVSQLNYHPSVSQELLKLHSRQYISNR